MITDCNRKKCCIGTNRNIISDSCGMPFSFITSCRTSILEQIIDKHHTVPYKTMAAYTYQFTNKTMRLNLGPFSNYCALLNFRKGSNKTIVPNATSVQIYRFDNFHICTKLYICYSGLRK